MSVAELRNDSVNEIKNPTHEKSIAKIEQLMTSDIRVGWPIDVPDLKEVSHGWFRPGNVELIRKCSNGNNKCIIELGSWLGASTKFILQQNPNALVFAVDIWSNDHFYSDSHYNKNDETFSDILTSNSIYHQFLANMKQYKFSTTSENSIKGLIPLKMDSVESLKLLKSVGVEPDFIYIDANHHYEFVINDVETCLDLFPNAILIGDDWDNRDVKRAVEFVMKKHQKEVYARRNTCWTFAKSQVEAAFAEDEKREVERVKTEKRNLEIHKCSFAEQLQIYKKRNVLKK